MDATARPRTAQWVYIASCISVVGIITFAVIQGSPPATANDAAVAIPQVDVKTVKQESVVDWQLYSGRLAAVDNVKVRPQVSGAITLVNIHDGQLVKKGDTLFIIDPRPYQAQVTRAKGLVAAAQARVAYTQLDWQRAQRLIADNAIARREYDEKHNAALEAGAHLQTAQAALDAAQIDLGFCTVIAPISGRVSRAEITLGNIVVAAVDTPPLTEIVSVSPIYAEFNADEQSYLKYISKVARTGDMPVELGLANETMFSRHGVIESVDNQLDTSSGTIRMRARFDNDDGALLPGLYARIKLGGSEPYAALLIDDAAIGTDQDKRFVWVVDEDDHVLYRPVTLGNLQGNERIILSGLTQGDRVVVNGTQRVRPGEKVQGKLISNNDQASQHL